MLRVRFSNPCISPRLFLAIVAQCLCRSSSNGIVRGQCVVGIVFLSVVRSGLVLVLLRSGEFGGSCAVEAKRVSIEMAEQKMKITYLIFGIQCRHTSLGRANDDFAGIDYLRIRLCL